MKKYYNVELSGLDAERLSYYLTKNNYKFEVSGAYNLTHFKILATPKQADAINAWMSNCKGVNKMETRLITQVKLYMLRLNCIFANSEQANIVLISPELSHLQDYYFKNRCEPYNKINADFGMGYIRYFAESSHLVDYNPADYEVYNCCTYDGAHGIIEEWVNMEDLERIKTAFARNGWIE